MPGYIGREKVMALQEDGEYVVVSFEGKAPPMRVPKIMYEAMKSDEPIDDSDLRDRRVMAALQEVVRVYLKYDLKLKEVDVLNSYLTNFLGEKRLHADAKLWKGIMSNPLSGEFHPQRTLDERTIGDLDRFLEDQKTAENKNA